MLFTIFVSSGLFLKETTSWLDKFEKIKIKAFNLDIGFCLNLVFKDVHFYALSFDRQI